MAFFKLVLLDIQKIRSGPRPSTISVECDMGYTDIQDAMAQFSEYLGDEDFMKIANDLTEGAA